MRFGVTFPERIEREAITGVYYLEHVQYHGPACKGCGSRRTKRVGETAARMCCVCGRSSLYGALIPEGE